MNRLSLTVCLLLSPTLCVASPIEILSTHYATELTKQDLTGEGATAQRQESATAIQDAFDGADGLLASASAQLLDLDLFTFAPMGRTTASADTHITFVPLSDALTAFQLDLVAEDSALPFSTGLMRLIDTTTTETLWSYDWSGVTGNVPWVCAGSLVPMAFTARIVTETTLLASHAYALTLHGATNSQSDTQRLTMRVAGVQAVPEPALVWLLLTSVAVAVAYRRHGEMV